MPSTATAGPALNGPGTMQRIAPDGAVSDGRPLEIVELPEPGPTNCGFGGADFSTLYVTSSDHGHIFALDWPVDRMRLFPDR